MGWCCESCDFGFVCGVVGAVGSGGVADLLAILGALSVFLACFGVGALFCCVTAPGGL